MKKKEVNELFDFNQGDFELMLIFAMRYSLGRMSYAPFATISFIEPMLKRLSDNTVNVMARDIEEHGGAYSGFYGKGEEGRIKAYGMECDYRDWMNFLAKLKAEQERRKQL